MDEEEQALLLEQARFKLQGGHSSAAASVVRRVKPAPESGTAAANPTSSDSPGHAALFQGLLPIVGDIVERQPGSGDGHGDPKDRGSHKGNQGRMGHPGRGDLDVCEAGPRGFPRAEHRSKGSRFKSLGRNSVPDSGSKSSMTSAGSADSDADAILRGMSPEEMEEAREELLARLPSKTVEFLRARNAGRENGDARKSSTGRGSDVAGRLDDGKMKAGVASASKGDGGGSPRPSLPAVASEVERLRFDLSGCLVEIGPESREPEGSATLQRDLLRHQAVEFYSVKEACTLARSTDANQRVFGLRLLQAVLRRCRAGLFRSQEGRVPSPAGITSEVTWIQLWQHAVYVAQVAKTVRYALDDENSKVVGAACGAVAGLVWVRVDDARYRHAPKCQATHMQRAGTSAGTSAGAHDGPVYGDCGHREWVSMPLDVGDRREDALGAGGRLGEDEEQDADERDIARVDPVSGLLNMRLLERLCFLLHSLRKDEAVVSVAAKCDVIEVVRSLSMAGGGVARAIARTPRLLDALVANLPAYLDEPDDMASAVLDILANLVDCVADWSSGAIRLVAKYASNAMLCHPRHPGIARLWRGLQVSGNIFTTLDDLYPKLCFGFDREVFLSAACSCETGNASAASSLAVLKEAYDQLASLDDEAFYDADEAVHDRVTAMLVFAQCCFREFSDDRFHGAGDDGASQEAETDREERDRISQIHQLAATCCHRAAGLIVRPGNQARVAACVSWSAALTTAVTAFMNLACVVKDATSLKERQEMARLALTAVAEDASLAPLDDPDILQPWDAPRLQRFVEIACLVDAIELCTGESNVSANRRLLAVLPPGADRVGLRLLSHMLGESANDIIRHGMKCIEASQSTSGDGKNPDGPDGPDNPDDLRVQVLSGMSASIGYELQGAAGWTSLRSMQRCFAGRRSIMDGQGSVFPLQPGWEFAAARASTNVPRCRGTLAWILGTLEPSKIVGNRVTSMALERHAALFDALFGSSYRAVTESTNVAGLSTGDPLVQRLATELFGRIMTEILSDDHSAPKSVWTMSRVREAAETFGSDSFGDPFFGSCFSTLFCDRVTTNELQEEILAILKDSSALHYLPGIERAPLGGGWILSSGQGDPATAMDFEFLLGVVSSQAFAKALATDSLAVDVVMTHLIRGADSDRKLERIARRLEKTRADTHRAQKYLSRLHPNPM